MVNRTLKSALIVSCFMGALACSHTPPKPISQQPGDYPFCETKKGLVIGAIPYVSEKQLQDVLSSPGDYVDNNVLPIQVFVRNEGSDELIMRTSNLRLVWTDGSIRNILTISETYEAVKTSLAGGAILAGIIGAVAVSHSNEGKMKDLAALSLKDSVIAPRICTVGFGFFPLKKDDTSLRGVKLRFVLQNPTNLSETILELVLDGQIVRSDE